MLTQPATPVPEVGGALAVLLSVKPGECHGGIPFESATGGSPAAWGRRMRSIRPLQSARLCRINIFAYQHGIYPRSEAVVAATRGVDRGRVGPDAVADAFERDLEEFVKAQQKAGLDFFSDGLLRWQDIFRPLVEASPAMRATGLVRWFDNNAFFRAPEVTGPLSALEVPARILPNGVVPEPRVATLPSPYMFSRGARTGADPNQLMLDLAKDILRPAAAALSEAGCQIIHLQEPWLGFYGIDPADWGPLEQALTTIKDGLPATLVFHAYFGDAAPHVERLRRLPVDAVGVDLVQTDIDSLGTGWQIGFLAGCLDGRSSTLESAEATAELVLRAAESLNPPTLYLAANCDLEFLPQEIARQKVQLLGEAARRVKELVAT